MSTIETWMFPLRNGCLGCQLGNKAGFLGKFSTLEIECIKGTQYDLKLF